MTLDERLTAGDPAACIKHGGRYAIFSACPIYISNVDETPFVMTSVMYHFVSELGWYTAEIVVL